ncbi:DUF2461 domain-containing protein [Lacinutrix jangbogonensis]|uniref:DUF2461 domain-containing protein n=1 Tax=Lacinutrix jangbogonensis TaxID=1469557 RepID=UPI00053DFADE|nr:DUF2461 domain-containing protein [Lacinutrix jangbogonensis]
MSIKLTLDFLGKLEKNNNRDWFAENKKEYDTALAEVKVLFNDVYIEMETHDQFDKMKLFRIYRDVRFSKNKQPYKNNFGGSFHRAKPQLRGGCYLQIQPGNNFMAAGFWSPEKEDLLRIRKEFEMDDSEIRDILNNKTFTSAWGELEGDALKTAPKGFDKEHLAIDLLRKKQYIFSHKFTDKEVQSPNFAKNVSDNFKAMRPFFDYMSDVLTTDLNGMSLI